jgi:hypothetical protein
MFWLIWSSSGVENCCTYTIAEYNSKVYHSYGHVSLYICGAGWQLFSTAILKAPHDGHVGWNIYCTSDVKNTFKIKSKYKFQDFNTRLHVRQWTWSENSWFKSKLWKCYSNNSMHCPSYAISEKHISQEISYPCDSKFWSSLKLRWLNSIKGPHFRDSSVGIVTGYGLDDQGEREFESR